jgi:RNA polymerase sigma-70 factor (ECF subfamily)
MFRTDKQVIFSGWVERYHSQLLGYAISRLAPDVAEAEELVQATWMKAWERVDQLRDVSTPKPWLFGILNHLLADEWKERSRHRWQQFTDEPLMAAPLEDGRVLSFSSLGSGIEDYADFLVALTPEESRTIEAMVLCGLRKEAAATHLGIKAPAISTRLGRLRQHMQAHRIGDESYEAFARALTEYGWSPNYVEMSVRCYVFTFFLIANLPGETLRDVPRGEADRLMDLTFEEPLLFDAYSRFPLKICNLHRQVQSHVNSLVQYLQYPRHPHRGEIGEALQRSDNDDADSYRTLRALLSHRYCRLLAKLHPVWMKKLLREAQRDLRSKGMPATAAIFGAVCTEIDCAEPELAHNPWDFNPWAFTDL